MDLVDYIADGLMGHCALESVTAYVVADVNSRYLTNFKDTEEMLNFAVENGAEIYECESCGWYVDSIWECEDGLGRCDECSKEWEYINETS